MHFELTLAAVILYVSAGQSHLHILSGELAMVSENDLNPNWKLSFAFLKGLPCEELKALIHEAQINTE